MFGLDCFGPGGAGHKCKHEQQAGLRHSPVLRRRSKSLCTGGGCEAFVQSKAPSLRRAIAVEAGATNTDHTLCEVLPHASRIGARGREEPAAQLIVLSCADIAISCPKCSEIGGYLLISLASRQCRQLNRVNGDVRATLFQIFVTLCLAGSRSGAGRRDLAHRPADDRHVCLAIGRDPPPRPCRGAPASI